MLHISILFENKTYCRVECREMQKKKRMTVLRVRGIEEEEVKRWKYRHDERFMRVCRNSSVEKNTSKELKY